MNEHDQPEQGSAIVIEARDVYRTFVVGGSEVPVLRGISLQVRRGETLGVVGASGAGKTTLINVLGALEPTTGGDVWFRGRAYSEMNVREKTRLRAASMGFVFQAYYLLPELSLLENVMLPAMVRRGAVRSSDSIRSRALELLEKVGLAHRTDHRPAELSGGEQQRAALARALMNDPEVVFADEPTGNLDSVTGKQVLDCLFSIVGDGSHSLVLVSHDRNVVERCTRVVRIHDGRLLGEQGSGD